MIRRKEKSAVGAANVALSDEDLIHVSGGSRPHGPPPGLAKKSGKTFGPPWYEPSPTEDNDTIVVIGDGNTVIA